ncbi:hypothetical protein BZG36_02095 [Bifiguratus adelaidae]|uniref:Uncharacterized protein n=1 Tax=Bifiguratus adelaidae TaxID=1938954 RepID=A0A261Y368_9FUNG|nr:hypothetical protein BZG36_02095 [Bifiguratus adelaidae]
MGNNTSLELKNESDQTPSVHADRNEWERQYHESEHYRFLARDEDKFRLESEREAEAARSEGLVGDAVELESQAALHERKCQAYNYKAACLIYEANNPRSDLMAHCVNLEGLTEDECFHFMHEYLEAHIRQSDQNFHLLVNTPVKSTISDHGHPDIVDRINEHFTHWEQDLSNSPIQDKVQVDIPFMPSTPPALSREKRSPRTPVQGSPTTPLQKCSTPVMPKLQTAPFKLEDQEVLIEEPLSLSARRTERYPLVHRGLASLLRSQHPNNTPPLKAAAPPTINEQRHL